MENGGYAALTNSSEIRSITTQINRRSDFFFFLASWINCFFKFISKRHISLQISYKRCVKSLYNIELATDSGPGSSTPAFRPWATSSHQSFLPWSRLDCRLAHSLYQLDSDGLVLCVVGQRSLAELTANTRLLITTEGPETNTLVWF